MMSSTLPDRYDANCIFWVITLLISFGNAELLTLFIITDPTPSFPVYDSPPASACIVAASHSSSEPLAAYAPEVSSFFMASLAAICWASFAWAAAVCDSSDFMALSRFASCTSKSLSFPASAEMELLVKSSFP